MSDPEGHSEASRRQLLKHLARMPDRLAHAGGDIRLKDQLSFDRIAAAPYPPGTLQLFVHRKAFGALEPLVPDLSVEDPLDFENSGSSRRLIPSQEVAGVPKPARLKEQRPYAPSLFWSRLIADIDLTSTRPRSRQQTKDPGVGRVHRFRA